MAEKNGVIEKTLDSNYLNVQKQEIEVGEKSSELLKDFSKKTAEHLKKFKTDQKEVDKQRKNTVSKYNRNLESINTNYNKHLEDILKSTKEVDDINSNELETAESLREADNDKLNKAIEKLEKDYLKQTESVLKHYDDGVIKSNKEIEQINKKAAKDIENLSEKLRDAKEKHETKVASFNEKKVEKISKLTEDSDKKITKVEADIAKDAARIAKDIEALKPVFDEKLSGIQEKIAEEKNQFDTKYGAIKSTLESKVARHEKFMNKNIKDNDQRAAKQHKKEITVLQKNAEKELKLLTGEHNDKFKVVDNKKRAMVQENLEAVAAFTKKLIQFREEKLYQIESYKIVLNTDVEILKLNTNSKIQDEINKFNEVERDNLLKLAGVVLKQEIDLEQEEDIQAKLQVSFDKENDINKVKQEEALENKAKELRIVEEAKVLSEKLSNLKKEIELSKFNNESKVAEKELVLDIKVNEENEIIDSHSFDFITQGQMSNENLAFQTEVKSLFETREDSLLAYEELEASNRADIKITFLEAQKVRVEANKEVVVAKINTSFEAEQVLYDVEREKASSKDLAELKIYEEEANKAIKKISDKRNALDPKAYKKEIKDLDAEITVSRDELDVYVRTKRENITSNTVLFDKGIEEVKARREKSIEDNEIFFSQELSRLDTAIALVNDNKNKEIDDAQNRHLKTFESTSVLLQNAQLRNNLLIEETTKFKISRIQNENDVIKDFKDIFEKQKFGFKELLDEALSEFDVEIKSSESRNKDNISKEEEVLEEKVVQFNKRIQEIDDVETNGLDKQASIHKIKYSNIEQKESNQVRKVKDEFSRKESTYKANISEIDRASNNESKSFEVTKKTVKKAYELALAKNIHELHAKLQQDIKGM